VRVVRIYTRNPLHPKSRPIVERWVVRAADDCLCREALLQRLGKEASEVQMNAQTERLARSR
jgi:hypothetical protein